MDADLQLLGAVIGVAAGVVGSVLWWSRLRITGRRLRRMRATPIRDAQPGSLVKIVGRVRLGDRPLRAPLSGRACACWEVTIESRPPDPLQHRVLASEARATDFYLQDDSGRARVDMSRGGVLLVPDLTIEMADRDPRRDQVLARFGLLAGADLVHMVCREAVVEENESVLACGLARFEPDPHGLGGTYREAPRVLVVAPPRSSPVLVSDDPQWGRNRDERRFRSTGGSASPPSAGPARSFASGYPTPSEPPPTARQAARILSASSLRFAMTTTAAQ